MFFLLMRNNNTQKEHEILAKLMTHWNIHGV